jgi:hypothetical protein
MDPPLTEAQLFYLKAFDCFLRARTDEQRAVARAAMSVRLNFVLAEANVPLPDDTRWTDSLGRRYRCNVAPKDPVRAERQRLRYHARKRAA